MEVHITRNKLVAAAVVIIVGTALLAVWNGSVTGHASHDRTVKIGYLPASADLAFFVLSSAATSASAASLPSPLSSRQAT